MTGSAIVDSVGRGTSTEQLPSERPYHHGSLRPLLVEVARQMLERDGLRNLSIRAVAREAGVSNAAPVHHFPTADDLIAACAADGFEELGRELRSVTGTSPADILAEMGVAYLCFADQSPVVFGLMFNHHALRRPSPDFRRAASASYAQLSEAVDALEPGAGPEVFDRRLNSIWGVIHGLSVLSIEEQICRTSPTSTTAADFVRDAVLRLCPSPNPE